MEPLQEATDVASGLAGSSGRILAGSVTGSVTEAIGVTRKATDVLAKNATYLMEYSEMLI